MATHIEILEICQQACMKIIKREQSLLGKVNAANRTSILGTSENTWALTDKDERTLKEQQKDNVAMLGNTSVNKISHIK